MGRWADVLPDLEFVDEHGELVGSGPNGIRVVARAATGSTTDRGSVRSADHGREARAGSLQPPPTGDHRAPANERAQTACSTGSTAWSSPPRSARWHSGCTRWWGADERGTGAAEPRPAALGHHPRGHGLGRPQHAGAGRGAVRASRVVLFVQAGDRAARIRRHHPDRDRRRALDRRIAISSEVDAGSRKENASKQNQY